MLPEFFVISSRNDNPRLWNKYIVWFNKKYNKDFEGTDSNTYYGMDKYGSVVQPIEELISVPILTLEGWKAMLENNYSPEIY